MKFDSWAHRELMVGYFDKMTDKDEFQGYLTSKVDQRDILIVSQDMLVRYLREATDKERLELALWLEDEESEDYD